MFHAIRRQRNAKPRKRGITAIRNKQKKKGIGRKRPERNDGGRKGVKKPGANVSARISAIGRD